MRMSNLQLMVFFLKFCYEV